MSKSLTDKTISGLNWSFIGNNSMAVINIVVGIILARLLKPQDFGLLGMTYIFIGLAELFVTAGMGSTVQRIKELTIEHIRVATTITLISSSVIYSILWLTAPFIADFFSEQRVIPIIRVLALIFLIQGFITVSYGQIKRALDFKYILKIDLSSNIVGYGLTSLIFAFLGFGVWSLVYGRIVSAIISASMIMYKIPISLKPMIRKREFIELAGFGGGISISNLIFYASSNIDLLVIGKFLNPHMLGLYTRSLNLMKEALTKITGGIYNVLFPAFAAVQDDPQRLSVAYQRTIKTVSYFVYPVLVAMIINAEFVISGLYGTKWGGAITPFQILALAGILRATLPYSGALAHATGKVYQEAFQQLVYLIILGGCSIFAVKYGINGIAASIVVASLWLFFAQTWLALKIINSNWKEFFLSMLPGFGNSIFMFITNLLLFLVLKNFLHGLSYEYKLIITVVTNALLFCSVIFFMPFSVKGDTINWLIEKYEKFIPKQVISFYIAFNKQK